MPKGIHFSKFISLNSDACDAPCDAICQVVSRAYVLISALNNTTDDDHKLLPVEIIKTEATKCKDNKWRAIALLVQHDWVKRTVQIEELP